MASDQVESWINDLLDLIRQDPDWYVERIPPEHRDQARQLVGAVGLLDGLAGGPVRLFVPRVLTATHRERKVPVENG